MHDDESTRVVLEGFQAFGAGDLDRLLGLMTDDVEWEAVHGVGDRVPIGGVRRGKDEVRRLFTAIGEHLDFSVFDVQRTVSEDGVVVAIGHNEGTVRVTGRPFATDWVMVFGVRDGRIASFREYTDTAAVLEGFGVTPVADRHADRPAADRRAGDRPF